MFKRVRFEANEQVEVCRLAQPDAGWEQLGGNWTLGYDVAVLCGRRRRRGDTSMRRTKKCG
eukprot:3827160-Prymnesium_polylepis.1